MSQRSQNERVLARLKRGPLTPRAAFLELGVMRLAARIYDLRLAGHDICATISAGKSHYAKYSLKGGKR